MSFVSELVFKVCFSKLENGHLPEGWHMWSPVLWLKAQHISIRRGVAGPHVKVTGAAAPGEAAFGALTLSTSV